MCTQLGKPIIYLKLAKIVSSFYLTITRIRNAERKIHQLVNFIRTKLIKK